jgi:hypothetical protein
MLRRSEARFALYVVATTVAESDVVLYQVSRRAGSNAVNCIPVMHAAGLKGNRITKGSGRVTNKGMRCDEVFETLERSSHKGRGRKDVIFEYG